MRAANDDDDTRGATEGTSRLTDEEFDAEIDARKYKTTMRAQSLSEEREALRKQDLGQFNFVTTLNSAKRQLIKEFADAVSPKDSTIQAAAHALLNDPLVLDLVAAIATRPQLLDEIEVALAGAADVERGRRTLAPGVAAAVDAVSKLEQLPLRERID
jgi:hypothetical protein